MENCEFIIQCNPYDKTINYKRRDAKKEWQPIVASSRLANYQKGAIQNYADAIIKEAVQATYIEPGKPAYFQGTRTDYDDFNSTLKNLQKSNSYQGINIIFDENNKLPEIPEAIREIDKAHKEINSEMEKYCSSTDGKNESLERQKIIDGGHLQKLHEELSAVNSGIYSVECEIKNSTHKYSYYLTVKETNDHLLKAFALMDDELKQAKQGLDNELKNYQKQRDDKKKELVQKAEKAMIQPFMIRNITMKTMNSLDKDLNRFIIKQLQPQTKKVHDEIQQRKDLTTLEANKAYHSLMVDYCNDFYQNRFLTVKGLIAGDLTRLANNYIKTITGKTDPNLTNQAKQRIMNYPMTSPQFDATFKEIADDGALHKRFLLFGEPTITPGAYFKRLGNVFKLSYQRDVIDYHFDQMVIQLSEWSKEKQADFINTDLKDWDERISAKKENINDIEGRISRLSKTGKSVSELLTFKENKIK